MTLPASCIATLSLSVIAQTATASSSSAVTGIGVAAVLAVVPILIITATSFIKISIVLAILRSALGAPGVPPTVVLTALAAVLTLFIMAPVGQEMIDAVEAADLSAVEGQDELGIRRAKTIFYAAGPPLKDFLRANTPQTEVAFFGDLAKDNPDPEGFRVLLPAFSTAEIIEAFLMGFLVYIPFFIIDLIVGAVLLAVGMHMLSPTAISLPLKLLLFVAVDGWHIILSGLLVNYTT